MIEFVCLSGNDTFSAWFYSNLAVRMYDRQSILDQMVWTAERTMGNRNSQAAAMAA